MNFMICFIGGMVEDALLTINVYYRKLIHMTEVAPLTAEFIKGEPVTLWQEIPVEHQTDRARWESEDAVVRSVDGDTVVVQRAYQFDTFALNSEGKYMRIVPGGCVLPAGATFHPIELRKNPFLSDAFAKSLKPAPSALQKFLSLFR